MDANSETSLQKSRLALRKMIDGQPSQLCRLAPKIFDKWRLDLFMASYMAMRRIDDQIDGLDAAERHARAPVLNDIAIWENRVGAASSGRVLDGEEEAVWRILARTLPQSPFGAEPFFRLAKALRHDATGGDFSDWADFWNYCRGATDAPTAIYLSLMGKDGQTIDWSEWCALAEPLARYCYLAHIVRDLEIDAAGGPQLLTLPQSTYSDLAGCRRELASILQIDDTACRLVKARLIEPAWNLAERIETLSESLFEKLSEIGKAALVELLRHYERILQRTARSIGGDELRIRSFNFMGVHPI